MSFAPSKEKAKTMQQKKKEGGPQSYRKQEEGDRDLNSIGLEKEDTNSKHNQSLRSAADANLGERLMHVENELSSVQQQQDMYRQLISLKDTVEKLQKEQKTVQSLLKRTGRIEQKLDLFEQRFDEYQSKTEKFLVVLDKNIDEESTIREDENKKIKKVCSELERRQKEMDYEIKMEVRNNEVKAKTELLTVAEDLDKKTDANREALEHRIDAVHRALKSSLQDSEDRIQTLTSRVNGNHNLLDKRIEEIEGTAIKGIDSANKRRKVDYVDLKAWLLDTIDERMKQNEIKLEDTVKKNYKSTVLQQKSEISNLKREVSALSGSSPNEGFRNSNIRLSDAQMNEGIEEYHEFENHGSELEKTEARKFAKQTIQTTKSGFGSSFKETKNEIDKIEKSIIDSGDQIGTNLDQLKISIFDWNDKIIKTVKKLDKLKKNKKQKENKKEIKGKISKFRSLIFYRRQQNYRHRIFRV
jgi:sulfur transfer protein SufE